MHIPDSVLSPSTCAAGAAAMAPIWAVAGRRVRTALSTREAPLLALSAAFAFTVMLFNIPALGGTTAHPVAGTLAAVLLGPWAATLALSVTLAIQALLFGDGGLLAYGVNCFTMAFVLPFVGFAVYRLLGGGAPTPARRAWAAGAGAYAGIVAAAAVVAVVLGIQPALFHEAGGQPLYFPFGLRITLPAMVGTHLLVAGPVEAIVTALAVRWLHAAGIPLYGGAANATPAGARGRRLETLWIGILALLALSPLGLLAGGDAWGEWDAEALRQQIQRVEGRAYTPRGVALGERHRFRGAGPLADYASERGALAYACAGALGVGAIGVVVLGIWGSRKGSGVVRLWGSGRADGGLDGGAEGRPSASPTPEPHNRRNLEPHPVPAWLLAPAGGAPESARPHNLYIERTLGELAARTNDGLLSERWPRQPGYLQRLDPRAKLIGLLALIVLTVAARQLPGLVLLYGVSLALAAVSRLPLAMIVRRVWLTAPLFVAALAVPSLFNVVSPGRPLLTLWMHPVIAITAPGLLAAARLVLRVATAVSFGALLPLTTPWNELLRGLRALWVPRTFVWVMAMCHRYLSVLLRAAEELFLARRSRILGRPTNAAGRRLTSTAAGALFAKALTLSEEAHTAMLSRGYTGEPRASRPMRWRLHDWAWLAIVAGAMGAVWWGCQVSW